MTTTTEALAAIGAHRTRYLAEVNQLRTTPNLTGQERTNALRRRHRQAMHEHEQLLAAFEAADDGDAGAPANPTDVNDAIRRMAGARQANGGILAALAPPPMPAELSQGG